MTKKYKFEFWHGRNHESQIVELDENLTKDEVDEVFNEWYSNELDYLGIEGNWEEVSDEEKTKFNQHILAVRDTCLALFVRCCDTCIDTRNEQAET